jgi:adenylylsulfate kinase
MGTPSNIRWHEAQVSRNLREARHGHKSVVLWFTGLSGAGKSTLSHAVEEALYARGCSTFVLDGDNVRHGLCADLGFSPEARVENIRRIGEVAKLFLEAGVITLTAFISPYRADREKVRRLMPDGDFVEIYCHCPIEVCEQRDVKGLYAKAKQGLIADFTGVSSPYEAPESPELSLDTGSLSLDSCVSKVLDLLHQRSVIAL